MKRCHVLVLSRYRLTGQALRDALATRRDRYEITFHSCGERDCTRSSSGKGSPDVVITTCLDSCRWNLRTSTHLFPEAKHIVVCREPSERQQMEWLESGVHGIVDEANSEITFEMLETILRSVCSGALWAPREVVSRLVAGLRQPASSNKPLKAVPESADELTPRERELLGLVASGLTNKQVGEMLFISEKTVKGHLTNIYRKLDVRNRLQATLRGGMLPPRAPQQA